RAHRRAGAYARRRQALARHVPGSRARARQHGARLSGARIGSGGHRCRCARHRGSPRPAPGREAGSGMSSAVATAVRIRTSRVRALTSAEVAAIGGLVVLVAIAVAATWRTWGGLDSDTGYDFVIGDRFAHGELPYVDSVYYYGPLAPALLGLAARIGGAGVAPFITLGLVIAC